MRVLIAISVTFGLTAPAAALAPPWSICDNADKTTSEFMAAHGVYDDTFPNMITFLVLSTGKQGTPIEVIAHCPTRQAISWTRPDDDAARQKINDIINANPNLTQRRLAKRLNRIGVPAQFGQLSDGVCACDKTTYYTSF